MKLIFKTLLIGAVLCLAGQTASAQTLKDILGIDLAPKAFAQAILAAKETVHTCPVCQNLTD